MVAIQFMKPFYTKISGKTLRLVFAYQYLSIVKDEELYHFIPIEGKEIVVDLETRQPINLSEVFVFQHGNKFIRMPLYQFFLVSNLMELIKPYIESETVNTPVSAEIKEVASNTVEESEVEEIILRSLIDRALDIGDEVAFMELSERLKGQLAYGC